MVGESISGKIGARRCQKNARRVILCFFKEHKNIYEYAVGLFTGGVLQEVERKHTFNDISTRHTVDGHCTSGCAIYRMLFLGAATLFGGMLCRGAAAFVGRLLCLGKESTRCVNLAGHQKTPPQILSGIPGGLHQTSPKCLKPDGVNFIGSVMMHDRNLASNTRHARATAARAIRIAPPPETNIYEMGPE